MASRSPTYDPGRLEAEVNRFWAAHGLPASGGVSGPPDGAVLHTFEGALVARDGPASVAFRAVAADVDARYLALVGRRAVGTLRWEPTADEASEPAEAGLLRKLAVWTGGSGAGPWDAEPRYRAVEAMVGRLARMGAIVSRDLPLRICPTCGVPRAPERIIYQEEEGDAYLVRFGFEHEGRPIAALVWVDAPWKLLGTCGVLIHPFLPYVVARYRRKDASEVVFTSRASLERFRSWIPDASFEVLEERPGREFAGGTYQYPLRHEFPMGGGLTAPAGTVLAVPDVTDTGTGIVPLVPGHGSTDAVIAASHGIPGWPLVTPRGKLDFTLVHKYAGLDLRTANEFIVRDLHEGDAVFAQLTVRRGVPHCLVCGNSLIWVPGRAWCLEPGRFPPEAIALYSRLLPGAPPLPHVEVAPWPVSETSASEEESAVALLECSQCERLDAIDGAPACPCGGKMYPVRRRLTASVSAALHAWARSDPFPPADSARIYLGHRRRVPSLIHHLAGMAAVSGPVTNVGLTVLPTLPSLDLAGLAETHGTDAVRAALVRTEAAERTADSFAERCRQEARRLERLATLAEEVLGACDGSMLSSFASPIGGFSGELEPEDRALLARWERVRVLALADFDRFIPAAAHRRVFRFLDTDLAAYRQWVRPRIAVAGTPASKRAALRALTYVVRTAVVLLSPILPFLAESVHRRLVADRTSIPETTVTPANPGLLDDKLVRSWSRWSSILASLGSFRRSNGLSTESPLPSVALVVPTDEEGDLLRADRPVLERLGHVERIEVGSPREPWQGRRRQVRPVESEIQRAYPSQASQIVHLLRRMPPRRTGEGSSAELSVVIQGLPRRVLPSMVEYVDMLPENTVPVPWALGELYVRRAGPGPRGTLVPPPLSPDAFWLLRHLDRRLRTAGVPPAGSGWKAIVSAVDPLASELRTVAEPLAAYLGLTELQVPESIEELPPPNRLRGRTRTGARWWVSIPGLAVPTRRPKRRARQAPGRRLSLGPAPPSLAPPETDFADEKIIAEEEAVRTLNQELDGLLRVPLLGPAKVRAAWQTGLESLEDYRGASYEKLVAIPGFGGAVAEALLTAVGAQSVPRASRPRGGGPRRATGPLRRSVSPPAGSLGRSRIEEAPAMTPALPNLPPPSSGPPLPADSAAPPTSVEVRESGRGPRETLSPSAPPDVPGAGEEPSIPTAPEPGAQVAWTQEPAPDASRPAPGEWTSSGAEEERGPPAASKLTPLSEDVGRPETEPEQTVAPVERPTVPEESAPSSMPGTTDGGAEERLPFGAVGLPASNGSEVVPSEASLHDEVLPAVLDPSQGRAIVRRTDESPAPLATIAATATAIEIPPVPAGPGARELLEAERHTDVGVVEPAVDRPRVPPSELLEREVPVRPKTDESTDIAAPSPASAPPAPDDVEEPSSLQRPERVAGEDVELALAGSDARRSGPSEVQPSATAPSTYPTESTPTSPASPLNQSDSAGVTAYLDRGDRLDAAPEEPSVDEREAPGPELSPISSDGSDELPPTVPEPDSSPQLLPLHGTGSFEADVSSRRSEPPGGEEPPTTREPSTSAEGGPYRALDSVGQDKKVSVPDRAEVSPALEPGLGSGTAHLASVPGGPEPPVPLGPAAGPTVPPTTSPPTDSSIAAMPDRPSSPVEVPTRAAPAEMIRQPPPPPGGVELCVGSQMLTSLQPFLEATAAGLPGLCVVRESPERVRAQIGIRPIEVYWLSNLGRDRTIRPNDLPALATFLQQKLTEAHVAVFFIEGVEYLARIHGVGPVLERLGEFDRQAREHDARVWLHINPDLLRPGELDRIAVAFVRRSTPS